MWGTRFVRRVWLALGRVLHAQVDFGAQSGCIHFFGCCGGRRSSTLICQPCLRSAGDLLRLRLKFRDRAKPYIFLDALRPGVDVGNLVWWLALGCVLHAQIQFRLAKRIGTAASMFLIARVVQIASSM